MKYFVIFLILICTVGLPSSFGLPPLERVMILSDTKIQDFKGDEIDELVAGDQVIIATPSFTTGFPPSVHYGCGRTIVDGDEVRCVGFLPTMQHVEGDTLIGESRFEQHAASITQIRNSDNIVVHLSWIDGVLTPDHVVSPTISWIPEKPGTYYITTFFWESIGNPTALGPPKQIEVTVN